MQYQQPTVNFPQRNLSGSTLVLAVLGMIMYSMLMQVIEQGYSTDKALEENLVAGQAQSARQLDDGREDDR
jgi:hypothetical protein